MRDLLLPRFPNPGTGARNPGLPLGRGDGPSLRVDGSCRGIYATRSCKIRPVPRMQPYTPILTLSASPPRPRLTMRNAPGLRLQRERRELDLRTVHRGRAGKDGDAEHQDQDQEDRW